MHPEVEPIEEPRAQEGLHQVRAPDDLDVLVSVTDLAHRAGQIRAELWTRPTGGQDGRARPHTSDPVEERGDRVVLAALLVRPVGGEGLDLAGAALSAVGLGPLLYPIAQGPSDGWPPTELAMPAAGVVVLVGFVLLQRARTRDERSPLLDLRLFGNRSFTVGSLLSVVFSMGIPGFFLVSSLYLQDGNQFGPFVTGRTILPFALGAAGTATPADSIAARLGRGVIALAAGLLVVGMAGMLGTLALVGPDANAFTLVPAMLIGGLGFGLFVPTLIDLVLTDVPVQRGGAASGTLTSLQQVGGALGVTLAGLVFTSTLARAGTATRPRSARP